VQLRSHPAACCKFKVSQEIGSGIIRKMKAGKALNTDLGIVIKRGTGIRPCLLI
jgi:hypothetical protein